MQHPETVIVNRGGVPVTINKDDHDPKAEKLWEDAKRAKGSAPAPKQGEPVEPPPILAGNPLNPAGQPEGQLTTR